MKKILSIILFLVFIFTGCSTTKTQKPNTQVTNSQKQLLQPEQVIKSYYKYKNDKNKQGMLTTLTKGHDAPNVVWGFEDLEYIKIINIKEETDFNIKEDYLSNKGRVNAVKKENLKVYRVEYDVKYKKGAVVPEENGRNMCWYFVIRKDKESPWLIDEMGKP